MKLIVLLAVLALRRLDIDWPGWLRRPDRHERFQDWLARLPFTGMGSGSDWLIRVLLPAVVVALITAWLYEIHWAWLVWLLGGVLLLWLIGVDSEFRSLDELVVRGRMNDADQLAAAAHAQFGMDGTPVEPGWFDRLMRRIMLREAAALFAVLFYFVTLGYWAALLYVLNLVLVQRSEPGSEWARTCHLAFYWLPSRLLILALALGGDFRRVMEAVEGRLWQLEEQEQVLADALAGALDLEPMQDDEFQAGVDQLEDLQSLLLRVLAIWLILAAFWVILVD